MDAPERFAEIDGLKGAGILAVVLIHSLRAPWDAGISPGELWLQIVTRFAVPAFLLSSGFLYATTSPIPTATVAQRLRRVLVPYLVASAAAQIWWAANGSAHDASSVARELLLGSSFGPYYYVFVHFFLVLCAPLFAILPRAVLALLTAVLLVSQGYLESGMAPVVPFFWHLRNPLLWWGYFLVGWLVRLHYDKIRRLVVERRGALSAGLAIAVVAFTGVASGEPRTALVRGASWLDIYAILGLLFVLRWGSGLSPRWVRSLADAAFAIYLIHLFFVYGAQSVVRAASQSFVPGVIVVYWSAGVVGSLAVIGLARALLGPRSRDIVGA